VIDTRSVPRALLTPILTLVTSTVLRCGVFDVSGAEPDENVALPSDQPGIVVQKPISRGEPARNNPAWPRDLGLDFPESWDFKRTTVLLIHGLGSSRKSMEKLADGFRAHRRDVAFFSYPSDRGILTLGQRLGEEILRVQKDQPDARFVIVAHSLGGLVTRVALESAENNINNVNGVFFIGTPHHGSKAHKFGALVNSSTAKPVLEDLHPDSLFLTNLNRQSRPKGIDYFCVVGCKGEGCSLDPVDQSPPSASRVDELRSGKGDGCVTTSSAQIAGVKAAKLFDLDHLGLLQTPKTSPGESAVILWICEQMSWK
jgi:pimeloyl-ACP methyl ester carboxylesterase